MKRFIIPLLLLTLMSCSREGRMQVVKIEYSGLSGVELLNSPAFKSVEIIPLRDTMISGEYANMLMRDGKFYISDIFRDGKIYVFSSDGKFLNTIGSMGRGPREYEVLSDFWLNDDGTVSVFSSAGELNEFIFKDNGDFIERKNHGSEKRGRYFRYNEHEFVFWGDGRGEGPRLEVYNKGENTPEGLLYTDAIVVSMSIPAPIFSVSGDDMFVCEPWRNYIYRIDASGEKVVLDTVYMFDFGEYNLPDDFYETRNFMEGFEFLQNHTFIGKHFFNENDKVGVLSLSTNNMADNVYGSIYGFHHVSKDKWYWYELPSNDFFGAEAIKYIEGDTIYMMADPMLMVEEGLADRFPVLKELGEDDNLVIVKLKI